MARRRGISNAKGEYLLFLDCDDSWEKDCLEQLDAVISVHRPDMVCFTAHSDGAVIGRMDKEEGWLGKSEFCRELLTSHRFNAIWSKAFRRELFSGDSHNYEAFRGICWGEDKTMLLHPVDRAERIYYLPDVLYYYQRNLQGLSKISSPKQIDVMLSEALFQLLEEYRQLWNVEEELLKVYQLKNLLNAYWRSVRSCKGKEEKALFAAYPWHDRYQELKDYGKLLHGKDRWKLLLAWRLHWRGRR